MSIAHPRLAVALVALVLATPAFAQVSATAIAISGQPAPGITGAILFNPSPGGLSNTGHVAIFSALSGEGFNVSTDVVLLTREPGQSDFQLRLRNGQPLGDTTLLDFNPFVAVINDDGDMALTARLASDGQALLSVTPQGYAPIAITGQPAPGLGAPDLYRNFPDTFLRGTSTGNAAHPIGHAINADGNIYYGATLTSGQGSFVPALFTGTAGDTELVIAPGQQAPTLPAGITVAETLYDGSSITSDNRVAFIARLAGPGILTEEIDEQNPANNFAIYMLNPTGQIVARSGQPAPGLPGRIFIGQDDDEDADPFDDVAVTPAGRIRFIAALSRFDRALYVGDPASPTLAAQTINPSAEINGRRYLQILNPSSNDADQVAFIGVVSGSSTTTDVGIFSGTPGNLRAVAITEQQAPGLPPGTVFGPAVLDDDGDFFHIPHFSPMLNSRGQVAFFTRLAASTLTDPPIDLTEANDEAIFATDLAGNLQLVLREGDSFALSPTDNPVISSLFPHFFNDLGQLAISVRFADNRSATLLATIPEPAILPMLALAGLLLHRRLRGLGR